RGRHGGLPALPYLCRRGQARGPAPTRCRSRGADNAHADLARAAVSDVPGPRVLLITGEYPPAIGGVGDYTALLAAHLRAAGARACVLTGPAPGAPDETGVRRAVPTWGIGCWEAISRAVAA